MPTETRSRKSSARRRPIPREQSLFNRREAAYFARVSLRQVDKAIEEKVVRPWRPDAIRIYLDGPDVMTVALIARAKLQLHRKAKKQIRSWMRSTLKTTAGEAEELALSDVLVIRLDPAMTSIGRQLDSYRQRRERYIETDPEIQGGEPVIAGTRLPVSSVATGLKRGDSLDDLAADYPGVPKTAFEAARIYAEAHPRRGRPARPWRDG
jgi:uncharacterized protein (DUF433 family)